jgi:hypothetical protein
MRSGDVKYEAMWLGLVLLVAMPSAPATAPAQASPAVQATDATAPMEATPVQFAAGEVAYRRFAAHLALRRNTAGDFLADAKSTCSGMEASSL